MEIPRTYVRTIVTVNNGVQYLSKIIFILNDKPILTYVAVEDLQIFLDVRLHELKLEEQIYKLIKSEVDKKKKDDVLLIVSRKTFTRMITYCMNMYILEDSLEDKDGVEMVVDVLKYVWP